MKIIGIGIYENSKGHIAVINEVPKGSGSSFFASNELKNLRAKTLPSVNSRQKQPNVIDAFSINYVDDTEGYSEHHHLCIIDNVILAIVSQGHIRKNELIDLFDGIYDNMTDSWKLTDMVRQPLRYIKEDKIAKNRHQLDEVRLFISEGISKAITNLQSIESLDEKAINLSGGTASFLPLRISRENNKCC